MINLSSFNYSLHTTEREKFSVPSVIVQSNKNDKVNTIVDANNVNMPTIKLSRRDRRALERKNKKRR